MKLFKNIDVCDLSKILKEGILPICKTKNNNWSDNRRANNSKDVVYLFAPKNQNQNSFPEYGIVLLELEVKNPIKIETLKNDPHNEVYDEYIVKAVNKEDIKKIYIPLIFKERLKLNPILKITWVEMKASYYNSNDDFINASEEILKQFAKTTELNSQEFNYFRGIYENKEIIDLYNISYS